MTINNKSLKKSALRALIATVATTSIAMGAVTPMATAQTDAAGAVTCSDADKNYNVTAGTFNWDLRDSWVRYIHGSIARGHSSATGDITTNGSDQSSSWTFNSTRGTVSGTDQAEFAVDGTLHFQGHQDKKSGDYILDNKFSNFVLKAHGTTLELVADADAREYVDTHTVGKMNSTKAVTLSTWTLTEPFTVSEGTVNFASAGRGQFTEAGQIAFGGFYKDDNIYTSPISGSFTFAAECPAPAEQPEEPKVEETSKPEDTKTNEPKVEDTSKPEEPKVEEPKVEEPKVEETSTPQDPKVEEPKVEEPKVEETSTPQDPKVEEPKVEETKTPADPKVEDPKVEEPSNPEPPKVEEPKTPEDPKVEEPSTPEPPKVEEPKTPAGSGNFFTSLFAKFNGVAGVLVGFLGTLGLIGLITHLLLHTPWLHR
ncbi:hypothetical protein F7230_08410 [Corynebacterium sp. 320]|uniref:HtaA domain-containing protein n=1 Tax=Corynebacterium TaxID=1716 RepID=UPI00125CC1AD|nr:MULTISPECIES: HtaA domain-containing protein [Corynebacterium]KAB1502450.1 hypothetical protein F7230_08410 [Corynebacterium sp. 320]KAB1551329.1 hypothetical protein F7233_07370 [Corynebacterium sp. 321]KAB1551843.1 hypothetical protein F7232_06900 [Corynebacterium sp. 319]KAB3526057.1 hypothetical protein F8354_08410 [Corynebacterium sp. 250]KAB3538837.1 hypothetical protein F8390_07480 [Corynebacterium sp. 366]